ncbi:MAG: hypothetical protein JNJ45_12135 [Chthonomonas sp.]|nr:hypothetical protein [Chthonomonas sp.]
MRRYAVLASLVAVAPLWAQDAKVSLHFNARPVGEVVAQLAEASGEKLKVSGALGRTIAVVHVDDVDAATAKKKLAEAFAAKWTKEGDIEYLAPDDVERRRLAGIAFAKKVAEIQKSLTKLGPGMMSAAMGGMATMSVGISMTKEEKGAQQPRTTGDILKEIAAQLPPNTIAGLKEGERAVFATSPNRVQFAVNPRIQSLLQEYVAVANAEASNVKQGGPAPVEDGMSEMPSFLRDMMREQAEARKPRKIEGAAKALLVATTSGGMPFMGGSLSVTLKFFNASGKVLAVNTVEAQPDFSFIANGMEETTTTDDGNGTRTVNFGGPKPPKPVEGKKLEFSTLAQEFMEAGSFRMEAPTSMMAEVSPKLAEQLRNPAQFDPLSYREGEALAQIAKTKKLNIIASLQDPKSNLFSFMRSAEETETEESFLKSLDDDYAVTTKDGWLTITPDEPSTVRIIDRYALTKIIRVANEKWIPSLDDIADYAQGGGDLSTGFITQKYGKVAPFLSTMQMPGLSNWDAVKFYGELGGARQQLRQSGITFGVAGMKAREVANTLLMGTEAEYRTGTEWDKENSKNFMTRMMSSFSPASAWLQEPTEVNPSGVPDATRITMVGEPKTVIVPAHNNGPDLRYGALDAEMFGMSEGMMEQMKDQPEVSAFMPDMSRVFVGRQTVYRLTFEVRPGVFAQYTLQDTVMDPKAKPVSAGDLPVEFRKLANKAKEEAKNMFPAGMFMGGRPMARP